MGLNGEYDKIGNIIAKEILDVKKEITPANIDSNLSFLSQEEPTQHGPLSSSLNVHIGKIQFDLDLKAVKE